MKHFNGLTPAEAERLACLAEELGEAIQIIGKILRHGYESKHPDGGPTNRELLRKEMLDVSMVYSLMGLDMPKFDLDKHNKMVADKRASLKKYMHHNKVEDTP